MKDRRIPSSRTIPLGLTLSPQAVHHRRLTLLVLLLTVAFVALASRLFSLQILQHEKTTREITRSITSYDPLRGFRGDIQTSDGTILARELKKYTVAIDPKHIDKENLPRLIAFISSGLGLADEERRAIQHQLFKKMARAERGEGRMPRYVPFRRGVSSGMVNEIRRGIERILSTREQRGMIYQEIHCREYPRGSFLGAVVGATKQGRGGTDLEGLEGLERALEESLASQDGERKLRCEGRRKDRWFWLGEVDIQPIYGYNAILTIDSQIQGIAEEELERGLERENAAAGIAIVMDCRRGDILAMVSLPSLDPNHFHDYPPREFGERRRNRAIENQYEPGSTIKPFIAAVALEKGLFRLDETIWSGGKSTRFGSRLVQDVRDRGSITFSEAVIHSSNIGMSYVGLKLGRNGLNEALDRFRFQKRTGIGLPGEATGKRTPLKKWSENYTSVSVSFGYEVMVTPIQLCMAFASLVNGGRLWKPRIVDRLMRDGEVIQFPPEELGRSIQENTSRKMREILIQVVEKGTAKMLKIPGFPFGAKTGTRVSAGRNGQLTRDCLSSFMAFAPADEPKLVVLVMIERPKLNRYGSTVAGPVAKGILTGLFLKPSSPFPPRGTPQPEAEAGAGNRRGRDKAKRDL